MAIYVDLVNELLRRLNETPLDIGGDGFNDARNLQGIAKDAINSSIREMLQTSQEWPFTLNTYTQTLTAGTGTYAWQTDVSKIDWDSFYLKRLAAKDNEPKKMTVLTYVDYLRSYRPSEDTSGTTGYDTPQFVYKTEERKFGVTPLPDDAYEIEYRYWSFPSDLTQYNDVCIVPDRFRHVLLDGAMMYMMRFRSNEQSAVVHQQNFEKGIDTMRRLLLDNPSYLTSTVRANRYFNNNTGAQ